MLSDLGDGHSQVTVSGTTEAMFQNYLEVLEEAGFAEYATNSITNTDGDADLVNRFATYTKTEGTDQIMVHVYFTESSGDTRVIAAKNVNLPSTTIPTYTKVTDAVYVALADLDEDGTLADEVSLENPAYTESSGSLAGIVRLEDGSFIVYDGGNSYSVNAEMIYQTLKSLAASDSDPNNDNNIVIRAWILSHHHADHVGGFYQFAIRYNRGDYGNDINVTLESVIYNIVDTEEQTEFLSAAESEFHRIYVGIGLETNDSGQTGFAGVPVYKALTGQVFHFPGMDMEILSTMTDFVPTVIGYENQLAQDAVAKGEKGDGNTMSMVVRLKPTNGSGKTVMLTGDATAILLDKMCERFGTEYLTSYIVTMPHHGITGDTYRRHNATAFLYETVAPTYALLPQASRVRLAAQGSLSNQINVDLMNTIGADHILDAASVHMIDLSTGAVTSTPWDEYNT